MAELNDDGGDAKAGTSAPAVDPQMTAQPDPTLGDGQDPFEAMLAAEGKGRAATAARLEQQMLNWPEELAGDPSASGASGEGDDGDAALGPDVDGDRGYRSIDDDDIDVEGDVDRPAAGAAPQKTKPETEIKPEIKPEQGQARERVVRRLAQADARITELERENRELRAARPSAAADRQADGDYVDLVMSAAAARLGAESSDDPRVRGELEQAARMLLSELAGDVDDPEIRRIREARRSDRKDREVQRQIDELRNDKERYRQEVLRGEKSRMVAVELQTLAPEPDYPYSHAAEGADLPARVLDGIDELVRGGYRITTDDEARDAISFVVERLESYHRGTYERLSTASRKKVEAPVAQNSGAAPNQQQNGTRGARQDRATPRQDDSQRDRAHEDGNGGVAGQSRPRTISASGMNGSRLAPQRSMSPDATGNNNPDPFEELLSEHLSERKRSAQRARG